MGRQNSGSQRITYETAPFLTGLACLQKSHQEFMEHLPYLLRYAFPVVAFVHLIITMPQ